MSKLTLEEESAFILHSRAFRETSAIVDCFTKTHGRISCVARSARGPKSRYKGTLQPFVKLHISAVGKGDLLSLGNVDLVGPFYQFSHAVLISGLYLNELLTRLLQRHDPYPVLFSHYENTLAELSAIPGKNNVIPAKAEIQSSYNAALSLALRRFEWQLLKTLGYTFSLTNDAQTGEAIDSRKYYRFDPAQGLVPSASGSTPHENDYLGAHILAFANDDLGDREIRRVAKRLMRAALAPLLGSTPLKTRELLPLRAPNGV